MAKSANLGTAKVAKQDEFYTQLTDIEKEMRYYRNHFKGKTVLCNCDDPFESNFFRYFVLNFNRLGLKKLIATCYADSPIANKQLSLFDVQENILQNENKPYKAVVTQVYDKTGDGGIGMTDVAELFRSGENKLSQLNEDGDFRSGECIELLKEADIVVTNPPFSLFREYIATLMEYEKEFVIIGNQNAITYKDTFQLLMDDKMWLGVTSPKEFIIPKNTTKRKNTHVREDGAIIAKFGNICWYTNLDIRKRHEELILVQRYNDEKYQRYDNYDAIEVPRIKDIPIDYKGIMGVPITFMNSYNPKQFKILGRRGDLEWAENECTFYTPPSREMQKKYKAMNKTWRVQNTYILDEKAIPKITYGRIFIQYTSEWIDNHPFDFREAK